MPSLYAGAFLWQSSESANTNFSARPLLDAYHHPEPIHLTMAAKKTATTAPKAEATAPAAKKTVKKAAAKTAVPKTTEAPGVAAKATKASKAPQATKAPKAPKAAKATKAAFTTPSSPVAKSTPSPDVIARAAYLNYRRRIEQGEPGDSHGDWLEAERQLSAQS
jgi:hypothetical protein